MKPRILKIDPLNVDQELIKQAAEVIRNRGLVAFPTETVYGLGADALDAKAVAGIFAAKDRPLDDPIIVHISDVDDLSGLVSKIPDEAHKLMERFWPGPLTMILKKSESVPDIVTAGLKTVAVRMPSNSIAREFIRLSDVPIAAPSANLFSRPSPTLAQHVLNDLDGRIDMILDGGPAEIGVESTVVEIVRGEVNVLRPGGASVEDLKRIIKKVNVPNEAWHLAKSPGKYPQHYSPNAKVVIVPGGPDQERSVIAAAKKFISREKSVGIMAKQEHEEEYRGFNVKVLGPIGDSRISASRLFHVLREFDDEKVDVIIAEAIPEENLGLAVMNRLRKAAGPINSFLGLF
jgi:L-threonylcarbamoyladenylate synthase